MMKLIRENKAKDYDIIRYYRTCCLSYKAKSSIMDRAKHDIYRKQLIENICKN